MLPINITATLKQNCSHKAELSLALGNNMYSRIN